MIESKEWQGTWFIEMPDGNEIIFRGILKYSSSNGCTLKASTDESSAKFLDFIFESNKIQVMRGYENIHHTGITLRNCIITNANQGIGVSIEANVSEILENLDYEGPDSLLIDKAQIEFSAFESWLNQKNSQTRIHHEEDPTIKYSFVYRQPNTFSFSIDEDFDIKFIDSYSASRSDQVRSGNFFSSKIYCYIISKKGKVHISEFDRYTEHLRRLLVLFYHQHCFIITHIYKFNNNHISFNKYYKQKGFDSPSNYPTGGRSLIKFNEIEYIAERVFQTWFHYRKSNDLTYVTFISAKSIDFFSEEIFLENARALEVYHKATTNTDYSFKKRLISLLEKLETFCDKADYQNLINDKSNFVNLVVKNRNYLTHYGDGTISNEEKLDFEDLIRYTWKFKVILMTVLIDDLGLNSKKHFSQLVNKLRNKHENKAKKK